MPGYPTTPAWYPVPVRQLRVLPPASSPPHLAVTQLPLANGSGQPARTGLAPPRSAPCLAHMGCKGPVALAGGQGRSPWPSSLCLRIGHEVGGWFGAPQFEG